jgi:orotidine-5'-phosphate decarboxylase
VAGKKLYQVVAETVASKWNEGGQCGLVVGATFPDELRQVRALVGDMPILVPGIGAQGGDVEATVAAGKTMDGGMMISSSRAILYASSGEDFAESARRVAIETRDAINSYR